MSRANTWTNSDGLVVGFGSHTEDNDVCQVLSSEGGVMTVTVEYTLINVVDTFAAAQRKPQDVIIPRGSVITRAILHTVVAPTSGSAATFELGTWGVGDVVDDADGIVALATIAEMGVAGQAILLDGVMVVDSATAASTQFAVGTTSNTDCVLAPSYGTAVFTGGVVRLVLDYIPPAMSAGRVIAA